VIRKQSVLQADQPWDEAIRRSVRLPLFVTALETEPHGSIVRDRSGHVFTHLDGLGHACGNCGVLAAVWTAPGLVISDQIFPICIIVRHRYALSSRTKGKPRACADCLADAHPDRAAVTLYVSVAIMWSSHSRTPFSASLSNSLLTRRNGIGREADALIDVGHDAARIIRHG
jgi:hypothetical protein